MSSKYSDSLNKQVVREQINLRLIKEICKETKTKLSYFGLPGSRITDLLTWREYIDSIDAVEMRENETSNMMINLTRFGLTKNTRVFTDNIDKILTGQSKYSEMIKQYQLFNLDYEGPFFTKGEVYSRIDTFNFLIMNQFKLRNPRFILFLTILGSRNDPTEIENVLREAEDSVDKNNNNAEAIFQYIRGDNSKQYEQLFVSIPIIIIYYGGHHRYKTTCTSIITYLGGKRSRIVHFTFDFSLTQRRSPILDSSRFKPIPLQDIKEIKNGKIIPFKSDIPVFTTAL